MIAIIPARGGSKGIPRKNIKLFAGKPLLAWTVEAARASGVFDHILLSTDDEEIADVGRRCGVETPVRRPAELARDDTPTAPVARHALEWLAARSGRRPGAVMVLEPTAPARQPRHLREAAALLARDGVDSVVSVSLVPHHYVREKQLALRPDGTLIGLEGRPPEEMTHRRQDLPVVYAFNGALFGCRASLLLRDPPTLWGDRVVGYVMERRYSVDLDTPDDWAIAEAVVRHLQAGELAEVR